MSFFDAGELYFAENEASGTGSEICQVEGAGDFVFEILTDNVVEPDWFTRAYASEECDFYDIL